MPKKKSPKKKVDPKKVKIADLDVNEGEDPKGGMAVKIGGGGPPAAGGLGGRLGQALAAAAGGIKSNVR